MAPTTCAICLSDDLEKMELAGVHALGGSISWREAARQCGLPHHRSLQNHMNKHFTERVVVESQDDMAVATEATITELWDLWRMAPPDAKPMYLSAIHNLRGLQATKPSQQHLMQALKTIQEMTGMKQEHRMMLTFAEAMFKKLDGPERPMPIPIESSIVSIPELGEGGE